MRIGLCGFVICASLTALGSVAFARVGTPVNAGIVWATPNGIYGADGNGRGVHLVTRYQGPLRGAGDAYWSPKWSRDGRSLAYTVQVSDTNLLYVVQPSAGRRRTLSPATASEPAWAPNGASIAFGSYSVNFSSIAVISLGSQSVRRLTVSRRGRYDGSPEWSPDGRTICFTRSTKGRDGVTSGWTLYAVGADGRNLRRLVPGESCSWSPDSRRIVYEWKGGIHVIGADGSGRVRLGAGAQPSWSPDGRVILFQAVAGPWNELRVMNVDGNDRRRVVRTRDLIGGSGWRPG